MTPDSASPIVRRFVLVAIGVPIAATLVALVAQLIALAYVPDPVAIHWGAGGGPNGFAPAWVNLVASVVVGLGIPLLIAGTSLPGLRRGDSGPSCRFMGATAAGLATLSAVLFAGGLLSQVGLDDARDAPSIVPVLVLAFAAGFGVGIAAWAVQPWHPAGRATESQPDALALGAGETAAWFGTASLGRGAIVAIAAACLLVTGVAVGAWWGGASLGSAVLLTVLALACIALAVSTAVFHVRVDAAGLTVTSLLGIPRFRVPLRDVAAVTVADVNPMGEFGGYGMRWAPGRFGIVLRRGEAIEIARVSGRSFVVTVDGATTGAALLQTMRAQVRHP